MNLRIYLTGKNGQVGWELQRCLAPLGEVTAVDIDEVDLLNPEAIRQSLREARPHLIVNPAAYTAVDQAEKEPLLARAINAEAPGIMVEEAKRIGCAFVHYSTDYVFDGTKGSPYTEADNPCPISVYGETKLAGERTVQAAGIPHLILRTSWVYGTRGKNFLLTVLRLAAEREELRIVDDQVGAPTWSRMIAETTALILARTYSPESGLASLEELSGVYHLTAAGQTTWYHFTRAILEDPAARSLWPGPWVAKKVVPIRTEEYPTPAKRPVHSVLSNAKLQQTFGLTLPSWQTQLKMALATK